MKYTVSVFLFIFSLHLSAKELVRFSSPKPDESFTEEMLISGKIEDFTPDMELFFSATKIPINDDGNFKMYLELGNPGLNEFFIVIRKKDEIIYRRMLRVRALSADEKLKSNFDPEKSPVSKAVRISTIPEGAFVKYNSFDLGKTPLKVFGLDEAGSISIYQEGYNEIRQNFSYPKQGEELRFTLVKMNQDAPKVLIKELKDKTLEKAGYFKIAGKIQNYKKETKNSFLIINEPSGEYEFDDIKNDGSFEWTYSRLSSPGEVYFRYTAGGHTGVSNRLALKYSRAR